MIELTLGTVLAIVGSHTRTRIVIYFVVQVAPFSQGSLSQSLISYKYK